LLLDRTNTVWKATVFESVLDNRQFLALIKGQPNPESPTLCRMHTGSTLADIFSSSTADGARNLDEAIDAIEAEGCGVVVYLPPRGDLSSELGELTRRTDGKSSPEAAPPPVNHTRPHGGTLREYGLGAQVLRELGVRKLR